MAAEKAVKATIWMKEIINEFGLKQEWVEDLCNKAHNWPYIKYPIGEQNTFLQRLHFLSMNKAYKDNIIKTIKNQKLIIELYINWLILGEPKESLFSFLFLFLLLEIDI